MPAAAESAEGEAGAGAMAGAGYRRVFAFAAVDGGTPPVKPYGRVDLSDDDDSRKVGLSAGAWKERPDGLAFGGGAGFSVARLKDDGGSASSVSVDAGVEKELGAPTLGAAWRLTVGTIGSPNSAPAVDRNAAGKSRGRRFRGESTERFAANDLSGSLSLLIGESRLSLRAGVVARTDESSTTYQTASLRIPVTREVRATPMFVVEQGPRSGIYGGLSLSVLF